MKKLSQEEFIQKAIDIHGNKFDYSKVEYKNSRSRIIILCKDCEHISFEQRPANHLKGQGCGKCARINQKLTTEEFIKRSKIIHGDKYDYSLSKYTYLINKIKIVCKIRDHGEFEQSSNSHLKGSGCPKCANENKEGSYNLNFAKLNYYKGSGYLYIIKMFNETESFIKIGVSRNLYNRFKSLRSNSKYNIEEIDSIFFKDFNQAIIEENRLHKLYKKFKYIPKNKFGGETECFKNSVYELFS